MENSLFNSFRIQISSLHSIAFQDFITKLFIYRYGSENYIPPRDIKDNGADGIINDKKILIACYGPKTITKNRYLKKINDDFSSYKNNWLSEYKNWMFVTNNDIPAYAVKEINKLKKDAIQIGVKNILEFIDELPQNQQTELAKYLNIDETIYSPINQADSMGLMRSMISGEAGLLKPKPLVQAIHNIHQASNESLENLDSRFKVISSYNDGISNFSIHAKEEVSLNLKINAEKNKDFIKMMEESIKHGTDVNLPMSTIQIEGSELFSYMFGNNDDGQFLIKPQPIVARDTIFLVCPESSSKEYFEVVDGNIVVGTESLSFEGKGLSGLLKTSYRVYKNTLPSKADLSFELSLWDKKDVGSLLYFDKLKTFIEKVNKGWSIVISSEINGQVLSETKPAKLSGDVIKSLHSLMKYIDEVKIISKTTKQKILFDLDNLPINDESYDAVFKAVDNLTEEIKVFNTKNEESFSFEIKTSELLKPELKLLDSKDPINFKAVQEQSVICFGQEIKLPKKEVHFFGFLPDQVVTKNDIKGLETIKLTYHPVKGSKRIVKLIFN